MSDPLKSPTNQAKDGRIEGEKMIKDLVYVGQTYFKGTFDTTEAAAEVLRPYLIKYRHSGGGRWDSCNVPNNIAEKIKIIRIGDPATPGKYDVVSENQ